jgi:hypothetical protein
MSVSVLSLWVSLLSIACSGGPAVGAKAKLQVKLMGLGRVMPDYSDAVLQVGGTYLLTQIPAAGQSFQSWIVATNWEGGMVRTTPALTFIMQSNLTITAVFVDTQPPVVRVVNLAPRQKVAIPVFSNAVFTVKGTARDNVGLSNVWYRLNSGLWTHATGTTAWSATVALSQPTNQFEVFAEDAAGNQSLLTTVGFFCVATDYLMLSTQGGGQIVGLFTGDLLELGRRYSVRAVPETGQTFAGWSGALTSSKNPLIFTMQSNMVLTANFVPNPFLTLKGVYNGLFYPADQSGNIMGSATPTNSGLVALTLGPNGVFGGRLVLQGTNLPFSGAFGLDLQAQVNVPRRGKPALPLNLQMDPDTLAVAGTVAIGASESSVYACRAITGNSNLFAGAYTLLLEGCEDDGTCFGNNTNLPWGDSPAAVKVSPVGAMQVLGTLADGTAISYGTTISANGLWPLYVPLCGGRGLLLAWLNCADFGGVSFSLWEKPPLVLGDRHYTNGFSSLRKTVLIPYTPPAPGQNPVDWTNGIVVINSDSLPNPLTNQVALSNNAIRVLGGSISNLTLTINASNGLFTGFFVHPASKRITPFKGALEQNSLACFPVVGGGWFLGPDGEGGIIRCLFPPIVGVRAPSQLLAAQPLYAAGSLLAPGTQDQGYAIPCATDWNGDGKKDLLVGYQTNGKIALYLNVGTDDQPQFASFTNLKTADGTDICHPSPGCGSPCPWVCDFDGDGKPDLLVGDGKDGTVWFYRNISTDATPLLAAGVQLQAGGAPLSVGIRATPYVHDWNEDGLKDLLCGTGDGYVYFFENINNNTNAGQLPIYAPATRIKIGGTNGVDLNLGIRSVVRVYDWDGDGLKDLVCSSDTGVYWCRNTNSNSNPILQAPGPICAPVSDTDGTLVPINTGHRMRLDLVDWNNDGVMDILVGNLKGTVYYYQGYRAP